MMKVNTCIAPHIAGNITRLDNIQTAWDNKLHLVKQFGKTSKTSPEDRNNIADFQLKELLRERYGKIWDETVIITDEEANYLIKELTKLDDMVATGEISTTQMVLLPPDVIHKKLPSANKFYTELGLAGNYEKNVREEFHRERSKIAENLKHALISSNQGKPFLEKDAIQRLRDIENELATSGSREEQAQYMKEITRIMESEEGKPLRDYIELMHMSNADFKSSETLNKSNQHTYNAADRTRKLLGTYNKSNNSVDGLAKVMIDSLVNIRDAVTMARTNNLYNNRNIAHIEQNDKRLNNFYKDVEASIESIINTVKDGGYMPHIALEQILQLRNEMDRIDFSGKTEASNSALEAAQKVLKKHRFTTEDPKQAISEEDTNLESHEKQRMRSIDSYFAQSPLFVLEKYANEVIMHNRESKIKRDYLVALKSLGDPKTSYEFVRSMKRYLTMQYDRAIFGVKNRPEWVNKTINILNSVEVIKSMGLGVGGATRNLFSGAYYLAHQVQHGIANTQKLLQAKEYKDILAEAEAEQGFKFLEAGAKGQGLDIVAEGALSEMGVSRVEDIDIQLDKNGNAYFIYKDTNNSWKRFDDIKNNIINKSLVLHRMGENKLRSYMFRTAFVQVYDGLATNPYFVNKPNTKGVINQQAQLNKAKRLATQAGLEAVTKWAFEYSTTHKAPIISGLAKKPGEQMTGIDYLTAAGSVFGLFLHFPMEFAALQARTLKRAADKTMAGDFVNSDSMNIAGFAGVGLLTHVLSLAFNTNLHHLMENDTINRINSLIDYATEEDPEKRKYQRGIINDFTGPIVQDLLFLGNVAHLYNLPDSEFARLLIGYQDFYEHSKDEQQELIWRRISTEAAKWRNDIIPTSIMEGQGLTNWARHEWGLYPKSWTRQQRKNIGFPQKKKKRGKKQTSRNDQLLQLARDIQIKY